MSLKILLSVPLIMILALNSCGSTSKKDSSTPPENNESTSPNNESTSPNSEPYYPYAWHINPDKSALTEEGYQIEKEADIHLQEAWALTKGNQVKVAVIDYGFEIDHEDLASNVIVAYNADENNSNVSYDGLGTSHGSTCAGFMVSPVNGKGIVGIAPEAKLIAIKQWNSSDADVIRGFEYAKSQGAKVINCNWGTGQVSQAVEAELKSLYDAGITVVFAAGNRQKNMDDENYHDESESPWVIGVGATGEENDVTSYSDYGSQLDILAPGGNSVYSIGVLSLDDMGGKGSSNQNGLVNNNYAFTFGTSFAAPIVAGVVTLMYSVNPNITPKQVRDILIRTAEKVGGDDLYEDEGFDTYRAYGKIHADRAVEETIKVR